MCREAARSVPPKLLRLRRQAEAVAGAQRKARQRRDCNAQVRHLMEGFGSEHALFYSTEGGYKLKQKKNDAGEVVEEKEFVGYGLAQPHQLQ